LFLHGIGDYSFTKGRIISFKKSLKISKGQSESVYRRRTGNTMVKRKSTKGQTRSTKYTYKTKDRVMKLHIFE